MYRQVREDRKDYLKKRAETEGKQVLPAAEINKGNADTTVSLGKIDIQSKHFTCKRLLLDLWRAWRQ